MIHCHFVLFGDLLQPTIDDLTIFEFFTTVKTFTAASCLFDSLHLLLANETQIIGESILDCVWILRCALAISIFQRIAFFYTTLFYFV